MAKPRTLEGKVYEQQLLRLDLPLTPTTEPLSLELAEALATALHMIWLLEVPK